MESVVGQWPKGSALSQAWYMHRPIRDGRAVTVNLNECVIVTTGTLATTSVTYNKHNSCTPEFGPHIRSNTVDKEKGRGDFSVEHQPEISSTTSECYIIYTLTCLQIDMALCHTWCSQVKHMSKHVHTWRCITINMSETSPSAGVKLRQKHDSNMNLVKESNRDN